MGGVKEYNTMTGRTVGQAFDRLREELLEEHGHDIYGGHQGNNELDTRKIFKSEKELEQYMEKQEHNGTYYKGTSFAYEIVTPKPNTNKTKTQVNRFPNKGTRKWETVYVGVADGYGSIQDVQIIETKQADAIAKARAYVEKNPDVDIKIQIGKRLIGEDVLCADVTYKPSTTERKGKWGFIGWCSC